MYENFIIAFGLGIIQAGVIDSPYPLSQVDIYLVPGFGMFTVSILYAVPLSYY
jgi:hypothetical protein